MSSRRAWLLAIGVVLSTVDAGFSLALAGSFQELNPILRPLLGAPAAFLVVKTVLAMVGMWTLAARERSRLAGQLLSAGVAAYAAVDLYWVWRALRVY